MQCEVGMRNTKVKGKPIITECRNKAVAIIRAQGKEWFTCQRHKNFGIFVRSI